MQGQARSQVPMGLSRRASMAYGRAASGTHLSTHVSGGVGEALPAGSEEDEEVESREACEKWLGWRTLPWSSSGARTADAGRGGHRRSAMRWRRSAWGLGSGWLEGGLCGGGEERSDDSADRGRGARRPRRRSSDAAARSSECGAMGACQFSCGDGRTCNQGQLG